MKSMLLMYANEADVPHSREEQNDDHRWTIRRNARAIGRLLFACMQGSRRGASLGGEDSDGKVWLGACLPAVVRGIMILRMG